MTHRDLIELANAAKLVAFQVDRENWHEAERAASFLYALLASVTIRETIGDVNTDE